MSSRRVLARIVLVLFVTAIAGAPVVHAQTPPAREPAAADIDKFFSRWATQRSPGCALGVSRDARVVLSRAYGMANLEYGVPNTPETIFESGSVAKQFTAASVVLLAREGKLSLDDDIRRHFPELPDYGTPVRIRQMLNHTSGFRDWGTMASAEGWPRGSRSHTQRDVLRIIARQKSLNFPPGTEYAYSNTNYSLAALLVERVAGMPFADFTRTRIFEPLGMTKSSWRDDFTRVVEQRATAYALQEDQWYMDMPFENAHGHGGMLTTVGDLLKWSQNFVDTLVGGAMLSREMLTRGTLRNGGTIRYALGLTVDRHRGIPEVSHSGATAGYRAYLLRYPEQHLSLALLCNAANVPTGRIIRQIADLYLGQPASPPPAANGTRLTPAQLSARAGLYRNQRDHTPMRLVHRDGALFVEDGPRLAPISESVFQAGEGPGTYVFVADSGGSTTEVLEPTADGDTTRYVAVARWMPTAAELSSFAGEYASEEANATYRVRLEKGKLIVEAPRVSPFELVPTWRDAFIASSAGNPVWFHRDARGRVTTMSVGFGRARDVRFTKTK
jgi:CubicO group peptidase (beta-lactamase class C family)